MSDTNDFNKWFAGLNGGNLQSELMQKGVSAEAASKLTSPGESIMGGEGTRARNHPVCWMEVVVQRGLVGCPILAGSLYLVGTSIQEMGGHGSTSEQIAFIGLGVVCLMLAGYVLWSWGTELCQAVGDPEGYFQRMRERRGPNLTDMLRGRF